MPHQDAPGGFATAAREPALLTCLGDLASAAGAAIMPFRHAVAPEIKSDGSPVTLADRKSEDLILEGLHRLFPGIPVVSEEAASAGQVPAIGDDFILVDALDGTKEFLAGLNHFTVNIGLIHRGTPVAGVVYAPALQQLWLAGVSAETLTLAPGQRVHQARRRTAIHVRTFPAAGLTAMSSLRHQSREANEFLSGLPVIEHVRAGSSVKFCLIAEGRADVYARFSPTMEWDTAAGHAVVLAAGGVVVGADGAPLSYGRPDAGFRNPSFIVTSDWRACCAARLRTLSGPD